MASQHIETVTKPFSIIQEINEQRQLAEEKAGEKSVKQSKLTFGDVVNLVKKEIDITFKERQNFEDSRERLELNHRALIGDREAEELLTNEINAFLRQHNLLNTPFPNYYDNLAQGIFMKHIVSECFISGKRCPIALLLNSKGKNSGLRKMTGLSNRKKNLLQTMLSWIL